MEQSNQQNQQQAVALRSLALDNAVELNSETVFRLAISEARLGQALRELEGLTAENAKLREELASKIATEGVQDAITSDPTIHQDQAGPVFPDLLQ